MVRQANEWPVNESKSRRTPLGLAPHPMGVHNRGQSTQLLNITQFLKNVRYFRKFAKAGLNLSQYMVAAPESINSSFCSVVEMKFEFFL